jgi:Outer membrane protein beta-barrel domain
MQSCNILIKITNMKSSKLIFQFIFICILAISAQSQEIHFGFQMSPTYNWMGTNNNKINNNGSVLGIKIGLVGDYRISESYSLTGGLNFHFNTGGKLQYTNPGRQWSQNGLPDSVMPSNTTLKFNLTYLEIPMGFKMRTQQFGDFRYFAELPIITLSFNTASSGTITGTSFDQDRIDILNQVRFFNLSWGMGAGLEYQISSGTTLVGGLYYNKGFVDVTSDNGKIYEPGKPSIDDESRGTISNITLRLGVIF